MSALASYLINQMPQGMAYPDAVQLCFRLFLTVHGVPSELTPLTKEALADAFSRLGRTGWVRVASSEQVTDPAHWLGVIDALLRLKPRADVGRGMELARQAGFVAQGDT